MTVIASIQKDSPAWGTRIAPGDCLLSINGHTIADVLDYRFYAAEEQCRLRLRKAGKGSSIGREYTVRVRKGEYEDLGLVFADGLMDKQHCCKNKCVFCFIDQLPPGLRESLYFKDDDARLGFLFGNYITLTNLSDAEAERIVHMRLSPVNISVHTTNPDLRARMMGNPSAGAALRHLRRFAAAGLALNLQLVLCPGWNDGPELERTLNDLVQLPSVASIAAVPVGLTRHRQNCTALRIFTAEEAEQVIQAIAAAREKLLPDPDGQRPVLCASDEFFLLAKRPIPQADYYGDYPQIENGVGLWRSFADDCRDCCPSVGTPKGKVGIVTGTAAAPLLREILAGWRLQNAAVLPIRNRFFGEQITAAGLLTAADVIAQLSGSLSGFDRLLLPAVMFNADGLTLDGKTCKDIAGVLGVQTATSETDAAAFWAHLAG
ncbi:MAG: DUF512 domain-containing protein [Oscillospiraceae bacterium]|nr:DUF512 domain-containing protein [Oscillospiraceae bacterium]